MDLKFHQFLAFDKPLGNPYSRTYAEKTLGDGPDRGLYLDGIAYKALRPS